MPYLKKKVNEDIKLPETIMYKEVEEEEIPLPVASKPNSEFMII